jgi:hypothetical protein
MPGQRAVQSYGAAQTLVCRASPHLSMASHSISGAIRAELMEPELRRRLTNRGRETRSFRGWLGHPSRRSTRRWRRTPQGRGVAWQVRDPNPPVLLRPGALRGSRGKVAHFSFDEGTVKPVMFHEQVGRANLKDLARLQNDDVIKISQG